MSHINFLLLFLIFVINEARGTVDPSPLCYYDYEGLANINTLLGIAKNTPYAFNSKFNLSRENNLIRWYINSNTFFDGIEMNYKNVIAAPLYHDVDSILHILRSEIYIDVDLNTYTPLYVCGGMGSTSSLTLSTTTQELCISLADLTFYKPNEIRKVRFGQSLNGNIKIYEFYDYEIVGSTIEHSSNIILNKLAFNNLTSQNFAGPGFEAIIYKCGSDEQDALGIKWKDRTKLEIIDLHIQKNYICDFVMDRGVYKVLHNEPSEKYLLPNLYIYPRNEYNNATNSFSKLLYLQIHGDFNFNFGISQVYQLFTLNYTKLTNTFLWEPFQITHLNQFSINKTQYNVGHCNLDMQNYETGVMEMQVFNTNEKFNLTQTINGISGSSESNAYPQAILSFPNCYIVRVECDTVEKLSGPILTLSEEPLIILERKLKVCPIN